MQSVAGVFVRQHLPLSPTYPCWQVGISENKLTPRGSHEVYNDDRPDLPSPAAVATTPPQPASHEHPSR